MRFHYLSFLAVLWYLMLLLAATPFDLPESRALQIRGKKNAGSSKSAGKQVATPRRNAYMIFKIKKELKDTWGDAPGWPTHSKLWIDGDENNGAIKLHVTFADHNANGIVLNYTEYSKEKDVEAPEAQETYGLKEHIGMTSVSNINLMNQNVKGTPGILIDAIRQDPMHHTGPANCNNLNSCHNVLERIVFLIKGLKMSELSQKWIQNYNAWISKQAGPEYNLQSQITYIAKHAGWTEGTKHRSRFIKNFETSACAEQKLKRDGACTLPTDESTDGRGDVLGVATSNRYSKLPDDTLGIAATDGPTAKPTPPSIVKDSRRYSYLSGWHLKFIFHIG